MLRVIPWVMTPDEVTGSVEQFQEVRVFERVGVINRYERWINEIIRRAGIHECKV